MMPNIIIFLLLPIHHFISFPANLVALKNPSPYQYTMWFGLTKNPADSLKLIANENIKKELPLGCKGKKGENAFCRYNETFAAVSGYCLWNKLECKKITGFDNKTKKFIPLSTKLWEEYQLHEDLIRFMTMKAEKVLDSLVYKPFMNQGGL